MSSEIIKLLEQKFMMQILLLLDERMFKYSEMQQALDINTATLANRLEKLEESGLITKKTCASDTRCYWYDLSRKGRKIAAGLAQL